MSWSVFPAPTALLMWLWQESKRAKKQMSVQSFAGNGSIWRAMSAAVLAEKLEWTNLPGSRFPRNEVKTLLQ